MANLAPTVALIMSLLFIGWRCMDRQDETTKKYHKIQSVDKLQLGGIAPMSV
jgi:hypothetical protein